DQHLQDLQVLNRTHLARRVRIGTCETRCSCTRKHHNYRHARVQPTNRPSSRPPSREPVRAGRRTTSHNRGSTFACNPGQCSSDHLSLKTRSYCESEDQRTEDRGPSVG